MLHHISLIAYSSSRVLFKQILQFRLCGVVQENVYEAIFCNNCNLHTNYQIIENCLQITQEACNG